MLNKNLIAFLGIAGCGAVWVPQLLSVIGREEPVLESEESDPEMGWADEEEQPGTAAEAATEPSAADSSDVAQLESFGPDFGQIANQPDELERIVSALTAHSGGQGRSSASGSLAEPTWATDAQSQDALKAWAAAHPLVGLVVAKDEGDENGSRIALVGSRVVRVGSRLDDGRITVLGITEEGVTLGCGEASLLLELPPFMARAEESAGDIAVAEEEGAEELQ